MTEVVPQCRNCNHYFITHDPAKPYGCRALRFKSDRNPALVVLESSGMNCQLFSPKKNSPKNGSSNGPKRGSWVA